MALLAGSDALAAGVVAVTGRAEAAEAGLDNESLAGGPVHPVTGPAVRKLAVPDYGCGVPCRRLAAVAGNAVLEGPFPVPHKSRDARLLNMGVMARAAGRNPSRCRGGVVPRGPVLPARPGGAAGILDDPVVTAVAHALFAGAFDGFQGEKVKDTAGRLDPLEVADAAAPGQAGDSRPVLLLGCRRL